MKRILILSVLILLVSCKKTSTSEMIDYDLLYYTWNLDSLDYNPAPGGITWTFTKDSCIIQSMPFDYRYGLNWFDDSSFYLNNDLYKIEDLTSSKLRINHNGQKYYLSR